MGGQLGKYDLLERLAVGGMAELFLARTKAQHGFQKTVVLKRILPTFAEQPDFVQMFLTEAKLAAGLHHPSIAQVFDFGEDDGSFFFTMEFVAGRNVRQVLLAGHQNTISMPLSCALRIVDNVAAGLHHAHEHRDAAGVPLEIVHRDVSPSNVLVTYDGNIKLVDFGIAKIAARGPATVAGSLKGKVSYMSPEQCRGELVDRRSDIFSLGTLLWELTTGRKLFGLDTLGLALLKQVERADIPHPTSLIPDYPPELEAIVLKAMARDRERRYATAQDFRNALEEFTLAHQIPLSSSRLSAHMETLFPRRSHESASFVSSLPLVPTDEANRRPIPPPSPRSPAAAAGRLFTPAPAPPPASSPSPSFAPDTRTREPLVPPVKRPAPVDLNVVVPVEASEPKTLVADRTSERDRTEVSVPEPAAQAETSFDAPKGSPALLWAGAAALLLVVGGGVWWTSTQTEPGPDVPEAEIVAEASPPEASVIQEPAADEVSRAAEAPPAHLPVMLADLRKLGYVRRHALLATDTGKVSVELHVGLDLVQAGESQSPCRTFSDALTIMEGSERPRAFLWALREAEAPTGKTPACRKLGHRLTKMRAAVEPAPEAAKPKRKGRSPKNTPPPAPAEPVQAIPVAEKPAPPAPAPAVATKLDDDLRGL